MTLETDQFTAMVSCRVAGCSFINRPITINKPIMADSSQHLRELAKNELLNKARVMHSQMPICCAHELKTSIPLDSIKLRYPKRIMN